MVSLKNTFADITFANSFQELHIIIIHHRRSRWKKVLMVEIQRIVA